MTINTFEEAMDAVKKDGRALQFVPEALKTEELCVEAVRQDGTALKFVPQEMQTSAMVDVAARQIVNDGGRNIFVSDTTRHWAEVVVRNAEAQK